MSNVITFLERMGRDAQLRDASQNEVELELARAQVEPELRMAILAKDQQKLEALLGGGGNVCCAQFPTNICCAQFVDESEEEEPYLEQCA